MGLVVVATILVIYLFNEPNRRDAEAESQIDISVERGAEIYASNCVVCHGAEGQAGDGRIGIPLNTAQNQTTDPILGREREQVIRSAIERGRGALMPAWLDSEGGPLNQEQVNDLIHLIREGGWELALEADIAHNVEAYGVAGTSTPPPPPTPANPGDAGEAVFSIKCATCHIDNNHPNGGVSGPNLTGLASMETTPIYGSPVDAEYLSAWVTDPQAVHPGTSMPNPGLTPEEVEQVVEYLLTLE
jgi:mono/diheme cytochrome c family protein